MEECIYKTPAKINLGLYIVSKRDDGYHNIETIFYPVELYDILTFKKSGNFLFSSDNDLLNKSPDNLIIKAKELLEEETNQELNVHIHLKKNIPIGGGLGGGSSDAAATLISLSNIFNLKINEEKLKEIALRLGSDVPFFLNPKPSYASSRGEILELLDLVIPYTILIVNPGIHLSTRWAFSKIIPKKSEFNLRELSINHLTAPNDLKSFIKNDFEEIVMTNYPEIRSLKDKLYEFGSVFVLMSGSGSTLFSFFRNNKHAKEAGYKLREKYLTFLQNVNKNHR